MIYSLVLILIFSLFPVHSFYITNAVTLEQCSSKGIIYFEKFDRTKLSCFNQAWRQTFIYLQYSCIRNTFTRIWTIQTNVGKGFDWPPVISLMTGKEYTRFAKTSLKDDPTIEENSNSFDPNNNQLTTYLWTSLSSGPQCRMRYTIIKEVCTTNQGAMGAKLTDSVCYYGKQTFNLQMVDQRQAFDQLVDGARGKSNPGAPSKNSSINNPNNGAQQNGNHFASDPKFPEQGADLAALSDRKPSFWKANKRFIIISGIILLVMIIGVVVFIMLCSSKPSSKKTEGKISDESMIE